MAKSSLGAARFTTSAIGPNGRTIYFDDLVKDGEIVEVGGRRMVVTYDPQAPDWFVEDAAVPDAWGVDFDALHESRLGDEH